MELQPLAFRVLITMFKVRIHKTLILSYSEHFGIFFLKKFGNFKFSPYLCTQYQKNLGVDWI